VIIGVVAGVLVIGLVAWFALAHWSNKPEPPVLPTSPTPASASAVPTTASPTMAAPTTATPTDTASAAPSATCVALTDGGTPYQKTAGGRITIDGMSFPELGSPWSCPENLPTAGQEGVIEQVSQGYSPPEWASTGWSATMLAAAWSTEAQDSPQTVAEGVVGAAQEQWYGDYTTTLSNVTDKAATINGLAVWRVDAHINYSVPGVDATYDAVTCVAVRLHPTQIDYVLVGVPNTMAPDVQAQVADLIDGISVP